MDTLLEQGLDILAEKDDSARDLLAGQAREEIAAKLQGYIGEIELFNAAYGLVGAADHQELVVKHILDSLAPLGPLTGLLKELGAVGAPLDIADAGSGAGLPGIPLAIVLKNHPFTLIERMGRRVGFLRNTIAVLGLKNVEVEQAEVEKAPQDRFGLVTFRAFRPLEPAMIKALFRLLTPQGVLAAYKARSEKIQEEMTPIKDLVGSWEVIETPVPFLEEERRLVVIRQR